MPHRKKSIAFIAAMVIVIAAPLAVIATDAFTDVPESNVHHDDIAWLKDAGVTAGCNPPTNTEYCPGDPVLRQQMASFMRRLAENQVVDAATAVTAEDAQTVGGLTPEAIVQGYADSGPWGVGNIDGVAKIEEIEVQVPEDGYLQIAGSASFIDATGGTMLVWLQFDDPACDNTVPNVTSVGFGYGSAAGNASNAAADGAFGEGTIPVTAGSHTITLCGNYYMGGPGALYGPSISAVFLKNATVSVGLHSDVPVDLPGTN